MQRLIQLFRGADFLILPTKAEAAGIVFSEASAYGLPSVTYATGGVTDYVRSGVNGVCIDPGGTAADFAAEIQRMLESPARIRGLCCSGVQRIQESPELGKLGSPACTSLRPMCAASKSVLRIR